VLSQEGVVNSAIGTNAECIFFNCSAAPYGSSGQGENFIESLQVQCS